MERGEWTKTQTLVLASALEALLQMEQVKKAGIDCPSLIRKLRMFRPDYTLERPFPVGGHEDIWLVAFHYIEEVPSLTQVVVHLDCDGACRVREAGHRWGRRVVEIEEFRDGRRTITVFCHTVDDPLVLVRVISPLGG